MPSFLQILGIRGELFQRRFQVIRDFPGDRLRTGQVNTLPIEDAAGLRLNLLFESSMRGANLAWTIVASRIRQDSRNTWLNLVG